MQQLAVQTLPGLDQGPGPHSRQQGQRTEAVFAKRGETELKATCISTAEHAVPSQKPKICWGTGDGGGEEAGLWTEVSGKQTQEGGVLPSSHLTASSSMSSCSSDFSEAL